MNRWQRRLDEMQSVSPGHASTFMDSVRNVQNVQKQACQTASERFGQIEQQTDREAATEVADPTRWRRLFEARKANRQSDGRHRRPEADLLAWRDVECRWHIQHGERVRRDVCAGCRRPIGPAETLDLIDGCHVHATQFDCLIQYGDRWRSAATIALSALGLEPPAGAP